MFRSNDIRGGIELLKTSRVGFRLRLLVGLFAKACGVFVALAVVVGIEFLIWMSHDYLEALFVGRTDKIPQ